MCGQYPGAVPAGATVSLYCQDNLPPARYVIVQFPTTDYMNFCELEVLTRGMSKRLAHVSLYANVCCIVHAVYVYFRRKSAVTTERSRFHLKRFDNLAIWQHVRDFSTLFHTARTHSVQLIEAQSVGSAIFIFTCLLYTSPSPRDGLLSRMPSSA